MHPSIALFGVSLCIIFLFMYDEFIYSSVGRGNCLEPIFDHELWVRDKGIQVCESRVLAFGTLGPAACPRILLLELHALVLELRVLAFEPLVPPLAPRIPVLESPALMFESRVLSLAPRVLMLETRILSLESPDL